MVWLFVYEYKYKGKFVMSKKLDGKRKVRHELIIFIMLHFKFMLFI